MEERRCVLNSLNVSSTKGVNEFVKQALAQNQFLLAQTALNNLVVL
jgi:hypothetical protein